MEADSEREALASLMAAWEAAHGSNAVALAKIDGANEGAGLALRQRIIEIVGCPGGAWNPAAIGRWFKRNVDRVVGGRRFERVGVKRESRWRLAVVARGPLS